MMKLLVLLCAVAGAHAACTNCNSGRAVATCTDASNDLTCTAGSQRVAYTAGTATSKPLAAVAAAVGNVLNNHASTKTCVACDSDTLTCTAGAQGADNTAGTVSTVCHHGFYKNSASPVRCVACNARVGLLAAGYAANGTCTDANNDLTCAAGVDDVAPSETHEGSSFVVGKVLNNATARVCIDCKANTLECTADASTHTTAATTSTKCRRGYFVDSGSCTACSTPAFTVSATTHTSATAATITTASDQVSRDLRIAPGMRVIMSHSTGTACASVAQTSGATFTSTIVSITSARAFVVTPGFPTGNSESTAGECVVSIEMATECTSATVDKAEGCAAGRNAAAATEYSLAVTAREGKVLNNHASPKCIWCKPNALSCTAGTTNNDNSSDTSVVKCLNGFFKNSSGNCAACSQTAPVALTCSSASVDLTCPAGVQSADSTTTKQAVSAVVGSILNNASNRKCIACKANTLECTAGAQGSDATANTTSTKCHRGYYINSGACTACSVTATVCGADATARLAAGLRPKTNVEACPTGEETAIPNTIGTACVPCAAGAAVCMAVGSSGVALADADDTGLATSCKSGFTAATGTCASNQFGTPPDFKVCTAVSTTSPAGAAAPGVFAALVAAVALALRM